MRALLGATWVLVLCLGVAAAAAARDDAALYELLDPPRVTAPGRAPLDAAGAAASALEPGRSRIERAWFEPAASPGQRVKQARIAALHYGIPSLDDAARSVLGAPDREAPLDRALLAVRLAPHLPSAHAALASAYWREGERGEAMREWEASLRAIPHSSEAVFWLVGSLLGLFTLVAVGGSLLAIALVAARIIAPAAHDLGEPLGRAAPGFARGAVAAALLLIPLLLGEGALGLALALFALAFAYGGARERVALAASAALVVLGLFPMAWYTGKVLLAPGADPVAEASLLALRGAASPAELELLVERAPEDALAATALAARARQLGRGEETRFRYRDLLERQPGDPVTLNNAANLLFEQGRTEAAIGLYERAVVQQHSVELLFNLAQANGRVFRMEALERSLRTAQEDDPELLLELTQARDANLVLDLPPSPDAVHRRMLEAADGEAWAAALRERVAPGWLGRRWPYAAGAFAVAALVGLALAGSYRQSGRCSRCGSRLCPRCDRAGGLEQACTSCRRLFLNPGGTDPSKRAARIAALRRRQARRDRIVDALSLAVPGVAGLGAGRPDLVFAGALVGGWAIAAFVARHGLVPDPLVLGAVGPVVLGATAVLAALGHLVLAGMGIALRRKA